MTQSDLRFEDPSLPIAGRTPRAKHASHSGAVYAAQTRGQATLDYVALLRSHGPLSDQAAAKQLGRGLSSVNSIRAGLGKQVIDSGEYEVSEFRTRRVRWGFKDR